MVVVDPVVYGLAEPEEELESPGEAVPVPERGVPLVVTAPTAVLLRDEADPD